MPATRECPLCGGTMTVKQSETVTHAPPCPLAGVGDEAHGKPVLDGDLAIKPCPPDAESVNEGELDWPIERRNEASMNGE